MLRTHLVVGLLSAFMWNAAASSAAPTRCVFPAGTRPDLSCSVLPNGLPNILYVGDSISINTMSQLTQRLMGIANICHIYANAGASGRGADCIDEWLGGTGGSIKWNYVLFNFGIHDIQKAGGGAPQTSPDEYKRNLDAIVSSIRRYGAVSIWVTTTPIPPAIVGDKFANPAPYAAISANEMRVLHVPIIDTYSAILPSNDTGHRGSNVHWTPAATAILADTIAGAVAKISNAEKTGLGGDK